MWCVLLLLIGCRQTLGPGEGAALKSAPGAWNRLLNRAVSKHGDVDYALIASERRTLDNYIRWVSRPGALRLKPAAVTHAYWLNTFNALTIYQIIDRDLDRVTDVNSALPWTGAGFYLGTDFVLDGQSLSLWEVGHERLTHQYQDYRDFGAVAIGARGGPPMRSGLYNSEGLGGQLDQQMYRFFMSDAALRFDADGTLRFSPIFDRYAQEFDLYTGDASLCAMAIRHTRGDRKERLRAAHRDGCPHEFMEMDWSLNGAHP